MGRESGRHFAKTEVEEPKSHPCRRPEGRLRSWEIGSLVCRVCIILHRLGSIRNSEQGELGEVRVLSLSQTGRSGSHAVALSTAWVRSHHHHVRRPDAPALGRAAACAIGHA